MNSQDFINQGIEDFPIDRTVLETKLVTPEKSEVTKDKVKASA